MSPPARPLSLEAARQQERASDPGASAWVSANAGSGKTTVLVRRVLRLLLAGVDAGAILCLTYTTAAAANMSNRLFSILSSWTTLPEEKLDKALVEQLGRAPELAERTRARRLFAQALETPGGLKIQTIHAFCTRVLQSAPFEAGVPAHFEVISDTDRAAALEEAIRSVLMAASDDPDGLKRSLDEIARWTDDTGFRGIIRDALARTAFLLDEDGGVRPLDEIERDIRDGLGVDPEWTQASIKDWGFRMAQAQLPFEEMAEAVERAGTPALRKSFLAAQDAWAASGPAGRFDVLRGLMLTEKGVPRANALTKETRKALPDAENRLGALQQVLTESVQRMTALEAADRSIALFGVARLVLARYGEAKRRMAALDFTDLVERTRDLLASGAAGWVLYKLDAGLDHLLVDEAQDTSADQWAILNALTGEFYAGEGQRAPRLARTVFAVGDEKQSIYGFQGAAPAEFGHQREHYASRDESLRAVRLLVSFRSTQDIIQAVDAVFGRPEAFKGLSSDPGESRTIHETNRGDDCGGVDLWDLVEAEPEDKEVVWLRPIDAPERKAPVRRLARAIARTIRGWMVAGRDDLGRPFQPGDALILMPKRKAAFEAVVRALKDEGVPVAGMDRLMLASHIAVEDMMAVARAALLPDDDLTFATALKTPIFGLDDEQLMGVAPGRAGSLRQALERAEAPELQAAAARFAELEGLAARSGPFVFFSTLLAVMGGRRAMLARLGPEAGDALDALLQRALDHEHREGPCLDAFLEAVVASADQVRRDLAEARGEVRVMTVHGAKGLEAKVVFIADLGAAPGAQSLSRILTVPFGRGNQALKAPVWVPGVKQDSAATAAAREGGISAAMEENRRLLYVAMTRAEDRLIICGVRPARESTLDGSWYQLVESGLLATSHGLHDIGPGVDGIGRRRFKVTPGLPGAAGDVWAEEGQTPLPAWLARPAAAEREPAPPIAPSRALAAADRDERALEPPAEVAAIARGSFVHLLLQWLPSARPEARADIGGRLGARFAASLPLDEREALVRGALRVLDDPRMAGLFGPDGLAEVELGGVLATAQGPRAVSARIDRLIVRPDRILLADFKTTTRPPAQSAQIDDRTLGQIALYRELLRRLHGDRPVRALVVYTAGPAVLEPSPGQLDRAMARITGA